LKVIFAGLPRIARLGPALWLRIPISGLNLATMWANPVRVFALQGEQPLEGDGSRGGAAAIVDCAGGETIVLGPAPPPGALTRPWRFPQ
jgi:hypothetical protein